MNQLCSGRAGDSPRRRMMLAMAALLVASCNLGPPPPDQVIVAGPVEPNPDSPTQIRGTFEVRLANPGESGLSSYGTGGACLVADLALLNFPDHGTCTKHSDCPIPDDPQFKGWGGYCAESKCWVRPGTGWGPLAENAKGLAALCNRSTPNNNGQPWAAGPHPVPTDDNQQAIYADVARLAEDFPELKNQRINWRVHACLNGGWNWLKKDTGGCGGTGAPYRDFDGPTTEVKL